MRWRRPAWMATALLLVVMALAGTGASVAASPAAMPPTTVDSTHPSMDVLMYNLTSDKTVVKERRNYRSAVQAAMLYSQCPTEYHVDEAKTARYNTVLRDATGRLRQAFGNAHQSLMFKEPSIYTWSVIDKYINDFQHDEAVDMGKRIQTDGCTQNQLASIDRFYESLYARDQKAKADAAAAEEKRQAQTPPLAQPAP